MKNTFKLFWIIAVLALIGFSMAACDNDSGPNNDPKSVTISGITGLDGMVGVFLSAEMPQPGSNLVTTAIQYGDIIGGTLTVLLVVPEDNTWNSGPAWTGNGDFYVTLIPVINNTISWNGVRIFTNGTDDPVKVSFNQAHVTLAYSLFRDTF